MTFKPTEDEWKIIDKADEALSQYKRHHRLSVKFPGVGSPSLDGMPKGSIDDHSAESKIVKHLTDPHRAYCDYCKYVIRGVREESKEYADILRMVYMEIHAPYQIMEQLNLSKNPYYDDFRRAKLVFGESCNFNQLAKYEREARKIKHDDTY